MSLLVTGPTSDLVQKIVDNIFVVLYVVVLRVCSSDGELEDYYCYYYYHHLYHYHHLHHHLLQLKLIVL